MKIIKKYIAIIMTALMLLCGKPVYAQEPIFGSSTIEYTVEDSYMVYIPESMSIGELTYINADYINIDPDKSIYVNICLDTNDSVILTNVHDSTSTLDVHFYDSNNNTITSQNTLVGTIDGSSTSVSITPYLDYYDQTKTAGKYVGNIYFNIFCE